jgi:hypothetical protein
VTPAGVPEAVRIEVIVPSIVSWVVNVPTVGDVPEADVPRYATPFKVRAMETALGETWVSVKGDVNPETIGVHTLPTVLLRHAAVFPTPGMIFVKSNVMRPAAVLKVANAGMLVGPTMGGVMF